MAARRPPVSVRSVVVLAVFLSYPAVAYVAMSRMDVRGASLLMLALLFGSTLVRMLGMRGLRGRLLVQAAAVAAILGAGWCLRDPLFMKMVPALIAASASLNFFLSLRGVPLVESFARIEKPDLPPAQIAYTRRVTHLWGWALAGLALLGAVAALQGSLRLWLILCFPVSYLCVGLLFAGEYAWRKRRFQEFDDRLVWDRLLRGIVGR